MANHCFDLDNGIKHCTPFHAYMSTHYVKCNNCWVCYIWLINLLQKLNTFGRLTRSLVSYHTLMCTLYNPLSCAPEALIALFRSRVHWMFDSLWRSKHIKGWTRYSLRIKRTNNTEEGWLWPRAQNQFIRPCINLLPKSIVMSNYLLLWASRMCVPMIRYRLPPWETVPRSFFQPHYFPIFKFHIIMGCTWRTYF